MHSAYDWVKSSVTKRGRQFGELRSFHRRGTRSEAQSAAVKCEVFPLASFTSHLKLRLSSLQLHIFTGNLSIGETGWNKVVENHV